MTFNERERGAWPLSESSHHFRLSVIIGEEFSNICLICLLKIILFLIFLKHYWSEIDIIRIAKESLRQTILMRLWYENPAWWFWLSSQTLWSLWKTKMESDYLKNWEIKRSRQRFFNPLRHTYVQRHHKCVVYLWL